MSQQSITEDARHAYEIAKQYRLHTDAIVAIISQGLAEDAGDADDLIREGEYLDNGRS